MRLSDRSCLAQNANHTWIDRIMFNFVLFGVTGDARLSMVLMSGMPTANTNLILAQEYNLDCQVTASTIAVATMLLPMMILMWKYLLQ